MWNILKINNISIVNFKKEVSLIFKLTNPFECYSCECLVFVCVFCVFTPFPFHQYCLCSTGKNYSYWIWPADLWLLQVSTFLKSKCIVEIKFLISAHYSFDVIHITDGVNIYLCMGVSVYWSLSVLSVFVSVSVWYQINTSKKKKHVSDLSKLYT